MKMLQVLAPFSLHIVKLLCAVGSYTNQYDFSTILYSNTTRLGPEIEGALGNQCRADRTKKVTSHSLRTEARNNALTIDGPI